MAKIAKTRARVAELEAEVARLQAELAKQAGTAPATKTKKGGKDG